MIEPDFRALATNPTQYDSDELNWESETLDSPTRQFFISYLKDKLGDLTGKRVIEIGSGTGYMTSIYRALGALEVSGIEPSQANVAVSARVHPEMEVFHGSLEAYAVRDQFDVAVSVMVFEHIADPQDAFAKVASMLVPGGRFLFVTGDYDYHVSPRFGYQVTVQDIGKGEAATATVRPQGVMHDIFRPLDNYVAYAKAAGFSMTAHVAMRPTPELIAAVPHYETFKEMALSHLLVLEKD